MTRQQKLQEIENQIREDIPRLMEMREGCLVIHRNVLIKILYEKHNHYAAVTAEWDNPRNWILDKDTEYEIIGHEITLIDWYEWLLMKTDNELYYYTIDGSVLAIHRDTEHIKDIPIDISKLYLKDQSEELINFLHNLKNK